VQNLLCAYLAAAVLIGLLGNALALWWLDRVIGLGIVALAIREGIRSRRIASGRCASNSRPPRAGRDLAESAGPQLLWCAVAGHA
jgi:hypothetical protein